MSDGMQGLPGPAERGEKMKTWDANNSRMRACLCLLLGCFVLCLLAAGARAAEAGHFHQLPEGVQALERERSSEADIQDILLIKNTPRGDVWLVLTPWALRSYVLVEGAWQNFSDCSPMPLEEHDRLVFRQHARGPAPGQQGAAGLVYPDDLGFDILRRRKDAGSLGLDLIQYHWQGEGFGLVGWQGAGSGQFTVFREGSWQYHDAATGALLGAVAIDPLLEMGLLADFIHLPHTLSLAQGMAVITEASAQARFPGWTLASYMAYNYSHMADAAYYRIEDGRLHLRRVTLDSKLGTTRELLTMPLPLSQGLLARLKTEEFNSLMDATGSGNLFLTREAFDVGAIPVAGKLVNSDLQSRGLLLLTEDEGGQRFLHWVVQEGTGYQVHNSQALPQEASLDLYHAGDGSLLLNYQRIQTSFTLNQEGRWLLSGLANHSGDTEEFYYTVLPFGVRLGGSYHNLDSVRVGSLPGVDAFQADLAALPTTKEALMRSLDQRGWAVVHNPNPRDRLHLRERPDKASSSLGKFYNRTPLVVLGQEGPWCRVRIGLDGHLEGYMLKEYLAFGADMDRVASALPDMVPKDGYADRPPYVSRDMKTTGPLLKGWLHIIGVVEDRLYIVMDEQGNTGYLPQDWFFEGNG